MVPMATELAPMTNQALADIVGCHFSTISRLMNGSRLPSTVLLDRIATATGCDRDRLTAAKLAGTDEFSALLHQLVHGDA